MNLRIAQFANLLPFALVMGVFWGTWFSLSRSIAAIRPDAFLQIGHIMIRNLGGPKSVLLPAALASSVVVLILLFRRKRIAAFYLAMAGLLLMVAAMTITLAVNVPIDVLINQWTVNTLPGDWTTPEQDGPTFPQSSNPHRFDAGKVTPGRKWRPRRCRSRS